MHKIRRLSPTFELFSALAEADILPTALFDELQQDSGALGFLTITP